MYTVEENQVYHFMNRIDKILETNRIDKQMSYTLFLINALDDSLKKKIKATQMKTYLTKWNRDKTFRRKLDIMNAKAQEIQERLAYLGDDYRTDQENVYDDKFEEQCREIEDRVIVFTSDVTKELLSEELNL